LVLPYKHITMHGPMNVKHSLLLGLVTWFVSGHCAETRHCCTTVNCHRCW